MNGSGLIAAIAAVLAIPQPPGTTRLMKYERHTEDGAHALLRKRRKTERQNRRKGRNARAS